MTGADDSSEELEVLEHHQTKVSIYTVHIYIYIYLEAVCPLFWGLNPSK